MLHDLYLLSCYFEPSQALLCEEALEERYGQEAVREALLAGWIELYVVPAFIKSPARLMCRLTDSGIGKIEQPEVRTV